MAKTAKDTTTPRFKCHHCVGRGFNTYCENPDNGYLDTLSHMLRDKDYPCRECDATGWIPNPDYKPLPPDNPVDPLIYCLAMISEECAEVQQMIGKALRFGLDTPGSPQYPYDGQSARTLIAREIGDLRAAIRFAVRHGFVNADEVTRQERSKYARLTDKYATDNLGRQLAPQPTDWK